MKTVFAGGVAVALLVSSCGNSEAESALDLAQTSTTAAVGANGNLNDQLEANESTGDSEPVGDGLQGEKDPAGPSISQNRAQSRPSTTSSNSSSLKTSSSRGATTSSPASKSTTGAVSTTRPATTTTTRTSGTSKVSTTTSKTVPTTNAPTSSTAKPTTTKPSVTTRPTVSTTTKPAAGLRPLELEIARLTNELRTNPNGNLKRVKPVPDCPNGGLKADKQSNTYEPISALVVSEVASVQVARPWSVQMTRQLEHRDQAGFAALKAVGITPSSAGENISYNGFPNPAMTHFTGWRESDGHFCNMMNSNFSHIGVGEDTHSDGLSFATQNFFTLR